MNSMFYNGSMLTSCLTFTAFQSFLLLLLLPPRLPTIYLTFSSSSIPIAMEIFLFLSYCMRTNLELFNRKKPQSFGIKFNTRYLFSIISFLYHQIQKDRKFVDMKTNWERQNEIFITSSIFIHFSSFSQHHGGKFL